MVVRIHIKAPTFAPMAQAPAIPPLMADCAALFSTSETLMGVFGPTPLLLFVLAISLMVFIVLGLKEHQLRRFVAFGVG